MIIARRRRGTRRGYSLPELLLGAAVIAAFLLRVYQSYSATREADQYEDFINQLTMLSTQTMATAQSSNDYSTVSNVTVASTLPINMIQSISATDAKLVTAYKQPISIKPIDTTLSGVTTTSTGIEIHAVVPQGACFRLAMAAPDVFGYMAVSKDGSNEEAFPLTNNAAQSLCGATSGTELKDVFLFIVPFKESTIATR